MLLRLTKQFSFEMAHALPLYEGKCRNIHGHSYHLHVTIEAPSASISDDASGMVLDFSQLKAIVNQTIIEPFDHALVLPRMEEGQSEATTKAQFAPYGAKLQLVSFQPTTENLLMHFAHLLQPQIPSPARLYSIKLYETDTSCAEIIL